MLKMNLQLFAHKKGVGSTKNGRDSEAKRLGAKRADGRSVRSRRQCPCQTARNPHSSWQQRRQGWR